MTAIQWIAAGLFSVALMHTFATTLFERMAHRRPDHAGVWHLMSEVEVVFGFWAMVLVLLMALILGTPAATGYLDSRDFTEPMFVFAIMVIAGSRAILELARATVNRIAGLIPLSGGMSFHFVGLSFLPLLGSVITEPAAMTLAAMMLRDRIYGADVSVRLKYATLGALFVNVSIGGTLTSFAAPPVLMVAAKWDWDSWHMLTHFGWRAGLAVVVNAAVTTLVFRKELAALPRSTSFKGTSLPAWVNALHVGFLAAVIVFAHHPPVFLGVLLFFLGIASAYPQFQNRLILREGLLVAFFLAGLVVLGGQQQWWLEPLLKSMDATSVFFGATALTAVTDNAALTYLASTVGGLSDEFKYAVVAGAVTGGGLTVIANAPNPAGFAILRGRFDDNAINPLGLLAAAALPTCVAIVTFWLI